MTIKDMFYDRSRRISWHNFAKVITDNATKFIQIKQPNKTFIFDDYNIDIIKNMYLYMIGHDKCQWNLDKGLFLGGKIGSGKTTLMKAFCDTLGIATGYYIEVLQAPLLFEYFNKNGINSLKKRPLMIDEVGREQLEIYLNGARVRPIEDLVALRYEYGALTFYTSNFKISTLSKGYDEKGKKIGYGEYIGDRLQETCNIVVLPGESRRR